MAHRSAELSATIASQLMEVNVAEGDTVTKGQLLASLDYREAKAAYQAAASAAEDESAVELAKIDFQEHNNKLARVKQAVQTGASNQAELMKVNNDFQRSAARLKLEQNRLLQAKHNKNMLRFRMESYLIRAPFDGIVTEIKDTIGNQIEIGQPVIQVVHYSQLNADLNLPLALFRKIQCNKTYKLSASSPVSKEIEAKLIYVSPVVNSASQTFLAKFEIDNAKFELPAGFTVTLCDHELRQLIDDTLPQPAQASVATK